MTRLISIAAGGHAPRWHPNPGALREHIRRRVDDADCDLIVFPEYAAMEAALIGAPEGDPDPAIWAERGAEAHGDWVRILSAAAREFGAYILAGSGPVREDGRLLNRAVLCAPTGETAHQDKMIPTPHERNVMEIEGGDGLTLFDTRLGKIGVLICYDAEFPLYARSLAAAGAEMLLIPSCTDTAAGQTRVRVAARARALENQCLVVQAPLMGEVEGCDPVYGNVGRVGFFGPSDFRQPDDGIQAQGRPDDPRWVRLALDPADILATRSDGDVETFADWPRQGWPDAPVTILPIGK